MINVYRKNQARKVVCIPAPTTAGSRPTGEVVPSDLWAWRKYGQKPIKGSPHPRYVDMHKLQILFPSKRNCLVCVGLFGASIALPSTQLSASGKKSLAYIEICVLK
jgi:hypothetical protein